MTSFNDDDNNDFPVFTFEELETQLNQSELNYLLMLDYSAHNGYVAITFYGPGTSGHTLSASECVGKLRFDELSDDMPYRALAVARYIQLAGSDASEPDIRRIWDAWDGHKDAPETSEYDIDNEASVEAIRFIRRDVDDNHNGKRLLTTIMSRAAVDNVYANDLAEWLNTNEGSTLLLRDKLCLPFKNMFDANTVKDRQNLDWDNAWTCLDSAKYHLRLERDGFGP